MTITHSLKWLQLDGNPLGDGGAAFLAMAIKFNATLYNLSLLNCRLAAHGQALLADALQHNLGLRSPDLFYLSQTGRTLWLPPIEQRRRARTVYVVHGMLGVGVAFVGVLSQRYCPVLSGIVRSFVFCLLTFSSHCFEMIFLLLFQLQMNTSI